jgi:hypothetical protein
MKIFDVTFTENKKYKPNTRIVRVETNSAENAGFLVHQNFGTMSMKDPFKHGKRITVKDVVEIVTAEVVAVN